MTTRQKQWLVAGVVWLIASVGLWLVVGCTFFPNGLWGPQNQSQAVPGVTTQPPAVETPGATGNVPGEDVGWGWMSDPALWGSIAVGVVYVTNQVRKSRKYNSKKGILG